jgi:hypothetical protein
MWPTQGGGRSCKYNLRFINEADETFIGGGQTTSLFVLMYGRVPTVDINICEVGGGKLPFVGCIAVAKLKNNGGDCNRQIRFMDVCSDAFFMLALSERNFT